MRSRYLTAAAAAFAMFAAAPQPATAAELTIAGSTTVAAAVLEPYEGRIERLAGTEYDMQAIGSSRGILALVEGNADIAAISAPLSDVVRKINGKRPGAVNGRELVAHKIGITKVAFVVHPSNTVKQVADILAGRINYWSQVGGINMPIEIITENKGGGIRSMVEKTIGEWGDVLAKPTEVQSGNQVIFAVSQVPTAIGIAAAAAANNSVFVLGTDKSIEQPLFLVTKGSPSRQALKLIQAATSVAGGEAGSPGS